MKDSPFFKQADLLVQMLPFVNAEIRARLKGIVKDEILQTVSNEQDLESEVEYLRQLFGR